MPSGCAVLFCLWIGLSMGRAADATRPIDYTNRNTPFAPAAGVKPSVQTPTVVDGIQSKRVAPAVVEQKSSAIGDRKAAIDVTEARPKTVQSKASKSPEANAPTRNALGEKRSEIATTTQVNPPHVARYQDSLVAASATNMARFPAMGADTTAKLNRFVFRKNAGEPVDSPVGAPISPAAGGSPVRK
jgi:hypothetical protein